MNWLKRRKWWQVWLLVVAAGIVVVAILASLFPDLNPFNAGRIFGLVMGFWLLSEALHHWDQRKKRRKRE